MYFAPSKYFRSGYLSAQDLVDATFKIFDTSHTIHSLAFGEAYPVGFVWCTGAAGGRELFTYSIAYAYAYVHDYQDMKNPLDNRRKMLPDEWARGSFQYFLKVVPTEYTFLSASRIITNQFSATEHFRQLTPVSDKGLPMVSFGYTFSPIMFRIEQYRVGFLQFLTSVCAIVGGVFTVKADKACVVQIFWGVRTDALQSACRIAASESQENPLRRRRRKRRDAALRVQKTLRAVRSLPEKLNHLRRQNAPHQLNDDDVETQGREATPTEQMELSLAGLFGCNSAGGGGTAAEIAAKQPLAGSSRPSVAMAAYDALSLAQATQLYLLVGLMGLLVYLLLLLSFFLVPNIKAQHPAANLVVWHAGCGFLASLGFVAAYAAGPDASHCAFLAPYTQFFLLAGGAWYLMLALDLLVALVNPWMGYSCKSWAYHIIVWSGSALSALLLYQQRLFGLSPLNICWLQRTEDPLAVNGANWLFLFGGVVGICVLSLGVLLFASFRFVRRQLDVTYRTKRRNLLQYYRYLLIFAGNWATCGALYYAAYRQQFHGKMAKHFELALALVFGSYPVLLLVVWVVNTELYQNRSSENSMSKFERETEGSASTEHFSAALRKDLMRYTTAGIRCSISESPADSLRSPLLSLTRDRFSPVDRTAALSFLQLEEGDSAGLYHEKKRLATTVYNGEYRYYEKLGFTDYAPKVFQNIRELCGIDNYMYEQSFADTLLERASEGKSGMLFYFSSDRKYLVKTMTKKEHSFLLEVLPLYHQYVLKQPNSLLCRFLGCHSMQLPVGWNKMFFVVMENVFSDGPVDERYDLKGIFHQSNFRYQEGVPTPVSSEWSQRGMDERSGKEEEEMEQVEEDDAASSENQSVEAEIRYVTETQPLLQRGSSRPSLRYDNDFVTRRASLLVTPTTRANLLAQVTSDCGFLQELGIMDYSCLLGIRHYSQRIEPEILDNLAHNAVVSANQSTVYYLGFVDILQHYNIGWKMQHCLLAVVVDKRKITALPPAEYALRFLNFIHEYLLRDPEGSNIRSYGSVGYAPPTSSASHPLL
ncbi:hypothetical protein BBJ28_00013074 [Nothophytophthora sp. Chile5]|nr:hypothetical protein BBJ28_00013074 [Nothophytophthora sp. Chile5]